MKRFRPCDLDQPFLLPPSLQDWLPEGHLVRFVANVVDALDLSPILDTRARNWWYCAGGSAASECSTNNGNVQGHAIRPLAASRTFVYDGLNRLASVSEGSSWSRTFSYDRYGNMWVSGSQTVPTASFTPVASSNYNTRNQLVIQSSTYDNAGQQTAIGGYTNTFDADGHLATSTINGVTTTYGYDANGRRVNKTTGGTTTKFVYGVDGQLLAEYGGASSVAGTRYRTSDYLGSTRLTTGLSMSLTPARFDYLPFGEPLLAGLGGRTTAAGYEASQDITGLPQRFTGKERDAETGLDYFGARYYSGAQGRVTSPDNPKFSEKTDPLTWNLYAYAANNPLARIDISGNNWFNIGGSWQWHEGSDVNAQGEACERGSEGCIHSDYTHLLKIEKTGKYKNGAEIEKLTLYGNGEDEILATGTGYTGSTQYHLRTTPNGDYEINLNKRGGPSSEFVLPDGALGAFPGGSRSLATSVRMDWCTTPETSGVNTAPI